MRSKKEEDSYCDSGEKRRYDSPKDALLCRNVATVETESPIALVELVRRASGDLQVKEKEEELR